MYKILILNIVILITAYAETMIDIENKVKKEHEFLDIELKKIVNNLNDTVLLNKQQAWENKRENECNEIYEENQGGSIALTEYYLCLNRWNQKRIIELKQLITSKSILPQKQPLYKTPPEKTKMYLIKGDKVEILEEKDDWYYILYHGKKDIKAWIPKSAVEEPIQKKEEEQKKLKPTSQNIQSKPNIQKEEKTFFSKLFEWFGISQYNKNMNLMVS